MIWAITGTIKTKLATCSPRPLGQTGQYVGRNKRAQTGTVRREQQP